MRKQILIFGLAALATFGLASCSDSNDVVDPVDPIPPVEKPEDTPKTITVIASLDDASRATFVDGESIKWTTDDVVTAWYVDPAADPAYGYALRETIAAENMQISEDGTKATFTLTSYPENGYAWLALMSNTGYDGCSARKVEFNHPAAQTQAAAGAIDASLVKLVSVKLDLSAGATITTDMKVVGSILRFIPYSAQGSYAAESIQSVELVSADNYISGGGPAVAYNFADYYGTELGYQWWADAAGTTFSENCVIFWDATSKSITTTLTTPFSLEGVTSAENSKGIYMAVPPVSVGGYKYVVTTDACRYTFDASTTACSFKDNTVKNVLLDLEKSDERLVLADVKGSLMYEGSVGADVTAGSTANQNVPIGYYYAKTADTGADYVTRENRGDDVIFYQDVVFSVIDNATHEAADWLEVFYREGDTWWDYNIQENTSTEPRSATVTATYGDVDGYLVGEAYRTKTITITQSGYSNNKTISFWGGLSAEYTYEATAYPNQGLSWWVMQVDGTDATDWTGDTHNEQALYGAAEFKCYDYTNGVQGQEVDWLTVDYKYENGRYIDTWWMANISANEGKTERRALVVATWPEMEGYTFKDGQNTRTTVIVQKANIAVTAELSELNTETIGNEGGEGIKLGKLAIYADGVAADDVAAAMATYNVSVAITGGASCSVAADGTITATIPANNYKNGGKVYDLTVTRSGATLVSAVFNQAEGTEEAPAYTYTFGAWQTNGNYAVQFNAAQFDHQHWLAVFNDTKLNGETPASLSDDDKKKLVMQMLNLTSEEYDNHPLKFTVEYGGAGESKILIGIKNANETGEMQVYTGVVLAADGTVYTNWTVNHLP